MPDAITKSLEVKISGQLPGEAGYCKTLDFIMSRFAGMDPAIQKRWDAILIEQAEDLQRVWRKLWVDWGVLDPK